MSGDDFIILPNGQKLYLKDEYGTVSTDKFKNGSSDLIIWNYDGDKSGSLNASEIHSIFNALKTKAQEDGNSELSEKELSEFLKEENLSAKESGGIFGKIKQKDILNFLLNLQEESQKNLEQLSEIEPTEDLAKVFPELNILELGDDRHIDTSKFSFENIRERLFSDTQRFEYVTEQKIAMGEADESGKVFPPYEYDVLKIIDKETKKEILSYDEVTKELLLSIGNSTLKITQDKNLYKIEMFHTETGALYLKNARILNGKLEYLNDGNGIAKEYNNGVVSCSHDYNKNQITYYTNGAEERTIDDSNGKLIKSAEAETILQLVNSDKAEDIKKLEQYLTYSFNENRLTQSMEDYYAITGRELLDDIKNSKLPEDVKTKFIKEMSEPFVESEFYNPNLTVENSQIKSKYYTGDEYSIKYNGPIITVENKTNGETTRINLKILFKNYNFTDRGSEKRTEKLLADDLKTLQSLSGEDLENFGIEISSIKSVHPKVLRSMKASAFYIDWNEAITTERIYDGGKIGTNIHELSHAIDNIIGEDGKHVFLSSQGKFKERYDKYMEEWEAKGHKRFDFKHSGSFRRVVLQVFKGTSDYGTFDENEAFAICLSGILGKPDPNFKYIEQNFPELIDLAKEIYLEVRNLNREVRNQKNA